MDSRLRGNDKSGTRMTHFALTLLTYIGQESFLFCQNYRVQNKKWQIKIIKFWSKFSKNLFFYYFIVLSK